MPIATQRTDPTSYIARRASTFADRRRGVVVLDAAPPPPDAEQRAGAWRDALAVDAATLGKRLRWDGLDETEAMRILAGTPAAGEEPGWLGLLREAYPVPGGAPAAAPADGPADRVLDAERPMPFDALLVPLVRVARARVRAAAGADYDQLGEAAHVRLERSLLERLVQLAGRALYTHFSVHRACQPALASLFAGSTSMYDRYVGEMAGGRVWGLFREYSVAARICGVAVELWADAVAEFVTRLAADRAEIERRFFDGRPAGRVEAVRCSLSDPHAGGRSVFIATFASGGRVVYKPRAVELDAFFAEMLEWLNRGGAEPPLRPLTVLSRGDYGWIEFAEHAPCASDAELSRFYTRCGALLCLAYALNGSDFHYENLIASGEHPVLIDMEALIGPRFTLGTLTNRNAGTSVSSSDHFERSVLRVGLLPLLKLHRAGQATDIGGIGGETGSAPLEVPYWHAPNTDRMRIAFRTAPLRSEARNRASVAGGGADPAAHVEQMVSGFRHTYRLLLAGRDELLAPGGPVDRLRRCEVRFIFRDTSLYASLLNRTLHPKYLRDGADRAVQLDVLCRPLLAFDERPSVWPIVRAEHAALEQMDVPLFTAAADRTSLTLPDGAVIDECFERSAVDVAVARLMSLDDADLALQCRLIAGAFAANDARRGQVAPTAARPAAPTAGPLAPITAEGAVARARAIARALRDEAIDLGEDGVGWFGVQYLPLYGRSRMDMSNFSLFDGRGGIGLFLAALEHVAPGSGYRDLALAALAPVHRMLPEMRRALASRNEIDVGAGTGTASVAYALAGVARLLDAPELLADANEVAMLLTPDVLAKDRAFDVVSGGAGAVLGLLAVHRATGDAGLLARAELAGYQLLEARVRDERSGMLVWPTWLGEPEAGAAHGACGIAHALLRLYAALGRRDEELRTAAAEALDYERWRLGPRLAGAAADEAAAAWSCGATGMALARIGGLDVLDTPELRDDVDGAVELALGELHAGPDTLCGGRMGRVELLLSAGARLGRPGLLASAAAACAPSCAAPAGAPGYDVGWRGGYANPGLFQGIAGVGYQLLRVTHPDRLPPILLWE